MKLKSRLRRLWRNNKWHSGMWLVLMNVVFLLCPPYTLGHIGVYMCIVLYSSLVWHSNIREERNRRIANKYLWKSLTLKHQIWKSELDKPQWNYIDDGKFPDTYKQGKMRDKASAGIVFVTRSGVVCVGRYKNYPDPDFEAWYEYYSPNDVLCWTYASQVIPPIDTSRLDPDIKLSYI